MTRPAVLLAVAALLLAPLPRTFAWASTEDAIPPGAELSGRDIYQKHLENRLDSAVQHQTMTSYDPGGSIQISRSWVRWKDYRAGGREPEHRVIGKWLVKFVDPFDVRHTGYLTIVHENRASDQFVYRRSRREIRRVKLKGTGVLGSDFTVDDLSFESIEDADYVRLADDEIEGREVYVVETSFKPEIQTRYHRTIVSFEKARFVPLLARYFDSAGVERKQMHADPESIEQFDGVWIATRSEMFDLRGRTHSELRIEHIEPNPKLGEELFSVFRLRKEADTPEAR